MFFLGNFVTRIPFHCYYRLGGGEIAVPIPADPSQARQRVSDLFERCYAAFVRYAFQHCGHWNLAEDAVQASMMALYRHLAERGDVANLEAWAFCVLRREVIRIHRAEVREDRTAKLLAEAAGAGNGRTAEPDSEQLWQEQDLDRCLSVLTDREAEVLLMRAQSMKYRQIASALGISVNTVKTLLARGLRKSQEAVRGRSGNGRNAARRVNADRKTLC
jgi:RNA polymerase sigma-70 factor (ECF subfamily)